MRKAYTFKSGQEIFWGMLIALAVAIGLAFQSADPSVLTDPRILIVAVIAGASRPALAALYNALISLVRSV